MILEVTFRCGNQAINPGQQLFGAVICMEDYWNAVLFGHGSNMEGPRDGTSDRRTVISIVQTLAAVELRTTAGKLNNNGSIIRSSSLKAGVNTG